MAARASKQFLLGNTISCRVNCGFVSVGVCVCVFAMGLESSIMYKEIICYGHDCL